MPSITTYIPENELNMAFRADVSTDGSAMFNVAGIPTAYNFFIIEISKLIFLSLNFIPASFLK